MLRPCYVIKIFLVFSNSKLCLTTCVVGNLEILELSLGILAKFQHSLDLPNIKWNYAVLVLRQIYSLFIYASK